MVTQRNPSEMDQPTINSFRKMYRVERHVEFLTACTSNQVIPNFCKISENVNNATQMSPREKTQFENRKLSNELNKKSFCTITLKTFTVCQKIIFQCLSPHTPIF